MTGLSVVNSASNSRSRQSVRMLALRLQRHQVDDVDDADLAGPGRCCRSRSTAASVSSVGTSPAQAMTTSGSPSCVVAGPLPDADARGAVLDRRVHGQPLRRRLLAGDDRR